MTASRTPSGNLEIGPDVSLDLGEIVVNEVADAVMRNPALAGPLAQRSNRGLAAGGEDPRGAEADDVGELG